MWGYHATCLTAREDTLHQFGSDGSAFPAERGQEDQQLAAERA